MLSILIISVAGILLISLFNYFLTTGKLISQEFVNYNNVAANYSAEIEDYFDNEIMNIESVARSIVANDQKTRTDLNQTLSNLAKFKKGSAYYIAFPSRKFYSNLDVSGIPSDFDPTARQWYIEAMKTDSVFISSPYIDETTGNMVITLAKKIDYSSGGTAVLVSDISVVQVIDIIRNANQEGTFAYLIDEQNNIVAHPNDKLNPTSDKFFNISETKNADNINRLINNSSLRNSFKDYAGVERYFFINKMQSSNWSVIIGIPKTVVDSSFRTSIIMTAVVVLVFLGISIGIGYIIANKLARPLINLKDQSIKLASKDLRVDFNEKDLNRRDEIGDLTYNFRLMAAAFSEFISEVNNSAETIEGSSNNLEEKSIAISTISEEIANTVSELAKGAMNQAEDTSDGTVNMTELAGVIDINSGLIEEVGEASKMVEQNVDEGLQIVQRLTDLTGESTHAAGEIFDVIKETQANSSKIMEASSLIAGISDQTNLLALNASIEAARAGDAGRGFSVVADEIRQLAVESQNATETINSIVESLAASANYAVEKMTDVGKIVEQQSAEVDSTGAKYQEILNSIENSNEKISEVISHSERVETGKNRILGILESLAAIAEENAASTQEVSASTQEQSAQLHEISSESTRLVEISDNLKTQIAKFKM